MSDLARLGRDAADYPRILAHHLGRLAPEITVLGDPAILRNRLLASLCSGTCPGNLILSIYDTARSLREAGVTIAGGFHSAMEKECLAVLLRGDQPIVVCPARSLEGMRPPAEWRAPLAAGRLLLVSPFPAKYRRVTTELAQERNEFVAALADAILIAHAAEGSRLIPLAQTALARGQIVYTLPDPTNETLIRLGAQSLGPVHQIGTG